VGISRTVLIILIVAGGVLPASDFAFAGISVSDAIVDFAPGSRPVRDILVRNHDKHPAYIEITARKILNPGLQPEQAEPLDKKSTDMIISPQKAVIPPGGRKTIRVVSRHGTVDRDVIYRATITPVNVPDKPNAKIGVKIVVAYGLLIIVRPAKPTPKLDARRTGKTLAFTNAGNTNIELLTGKQCPPGVTDESKCQKLSGERLYAGLSTTVSLPFDAPVEFTYRVAGENFAERYP
jgi:P pilus assembly chaperone PapD